MRQELVYYHGDHIIKNVCSTLHAKKFYSENLNGRDHLQDLGSVYMYYEFVPGFQRNVRRYIALPFVLALAVKT